MKRKIAIFAFLCLVLAIYGMQPSVAEAKAAKQGSGGSGGTPAQGGSGSTDQGAPDSGNMGTGTGTSDTGNTTGTSHKGAGGSTTGKLSASDRAFVKEAVVGGLMEVQLGQLAQQKAESSDVKDFGSRMEKDHSAANSELQRIAAEKNITLPTEIDAIHKSTITKLSSDSGAAFDKAYMRDMVKDHIEDVAKFKKAARTLKDPDLKNWASTTLATLEQHLDLAKTTAEKVGATTKTSKTKSSSSH